MRRRPGELLALEEHILTIALELMNHSGGTSAGGGGWFHAYGIAELLTEAHGESVLAHGTLYRSLRGLANQKYLDKRVESEEEVATHAGPPRRYYRITGEGEAVLDAARHRFKVTKSQLRSITPRAAPLQP